MQQLTASEHSALINLAAAIQAGSPLRRQVLAMLQRDRNPFEDDLHQGLPEKVWSAFTGGDFQIVGSQAWDYTWSLLPGEGRTPAQQKLLATARPGDLAFISAKATSPRAHANAVNQVESLGLLPGYQLIARLPLAKGRLLSLWRQ